MKNSQISDYLEIGNQLPIAGQATDPRSLGYVYVIGFARNDIVKIGSATCPQSRLLSLQCGNPFELRVLGLVCVYEGSAFEIEHAAHKVASSRRIRGEWFAMEPHEAVEAIIKAARNMKAKFGAYSVERRRIDAEYDAEISNREDQRRANMRRKLGID